MDRQPIYPNPQRSLTGRILIPPDARKTLTMLFLGTTQPRNIVLASFSVVVYPSRIPQRGLSAPHESARRLPYQVRD